MSSPNFDALIAEFPREKPLIAVLRRIVEERQPREMTFEHLSREVDPAVIGRFSLLLGALVERGELGRTVRVESRTGNGGIGDYESVADVPEHIYDWRAATEVDVSPRDLQVVYRFTP